MEGLALGPVQARKYNLPSGHIQRNHPRLPVGPPNEKAAELAPRGPRCCLLDAYFASTAFTMSVAPPDFARM